jgi:putative serine protease PepD
MEPEQPTRPLWLDPSATTPAAASPTSDLPPVEDLDAEVPYGGDAGGPAAAPPPPPLPPSPPNPLPPDPAPAVAGGAGWLKPAIAGAVVGALVAAGVAGGIVAASDDDDGGRAAVAAVTRSSASLAGEKLDVAAVLDAVEQGVVAIHVSGSSQAPFGTGRAESAGSGMIIDDEGLVLTNAHVVNGANSIQVTLADGRDIAADLVGASSSDDVALIRLRDTSDLSPVELGNSDELQVGDSVVAVGNALNLGATPTVTTGIVSALNRTIEAEGESLENLIQTDAAINRGNSGGPLVDASGKVIGVNTAIAADGQNIGFALSINEVRAIVDSVRNGGGDQSIAFLGVRTASVADVSAAVLERLNIDLDEGAFVQAVEPGTAAQAAGLEAGDVITEVDGDAVTTAAALTEAIQEHEPKDRVRITYVRDGESTTVTVTLGSKAAPAG